MSPDADCVAATARDKVETISPRPTPSSKSSETGKDTTKTNRDEIIYYLAYGSNLCRQTFLGMRGIRPLSQINVSVPTLKLTLGLPGIAYKEPRFANVEYRDVPEQSTATPPRYDLGEWDGGLIGVVYGVTKEDYRQIMRTEGGGSGYQEIFVPCIPIWKDLPLAEGAPLPEAPEPVVARTLCASQKPEDDPENPGHRSWWRRLIMGQRYRAPDSGEASARYLNLLKTGAEEHNLPDAWKDYLASMQPYMITTTRQRIGGFLLMLTWGPPILGFMWFARQFADENGKYPPVLSTIMTFQFNTIWRVYDWFYKPIFGDGEATEVKGHQPKLRDLGMNGKAEETKPLLDA